MKIFLYFSILSTVLFANYLDENLKKTQWNDIEVIWIQDETFPTYDISIYFKAGAFEETEEKEGATSLALNLMTLGTDRFDQNYILDTLDFYGVSKAAYVTHEFSTYNLSGLVKDVVPTMKMICHLFSRASFPKAELSQTLRRLLSSQKNMVNNHSSLASHIARMITLAGTGYERSVEGNLKSLSTMTSNDLKDRLWYLSKKAYKRIYMRGPKELASLENIFKNDCEWNSYKKESSLPKVKSLSESNQGKVILIPVEKANQAQVRIGTFMSYDQAQSDIELTSFTNKFIGGGFTSRLMQGLRLEKGLTYSVSSYASAQRNYGRKGIATFTKNESIGDLLSSIDEIVDKNSSNIDKEILKRAKIFVKGNYLFELESTSNFLSTLQYYDHINRDYSNIYKYPKRIDEISKQDVQRKVKNLFQDPSSIIVIVGDKSLKEKLKSLGYKVEIREAKDFL